MRKIAAWMIVTMLVLLTACGRDVPDETPTDMPKATGAPTATLAPTEAPTDAPEPTNTPEPTSAPTMAPQETLTPEPIKEPTETKLVLGEYIGMVLYDVTDAEVDAQIKEMLAEFAVYEIADRPAKLGDITNINYVGKLDGVAFEGGTDDSEEGTDLELGSGSFIDGFEEGLIGAVAGEVRDLTLTFPEEYHSAEMAGKTVVFTVTVNSVVEPVYPELTDEFVSENLSAGMTAQEYRREVYEQMRWESLSGQAMNNLMNAAVLESYPEEEMLASAMEIINSYLASAEYYASILGADTETILQFFGFANSTELYEYAFFYAEYMLKSMLVVSAVAVREDIVLTEDIYAERALEYAYANGYTDLEMFEADYGVGEIEEAILADLVIEYIIANANIVKEN